MTRRASVLLGLAALAAATVPSQAVAAGRCHRTVPETTGSISWCLVDGAGRYAVVTAEQWELRVYTGATCTGLPQDIDTPLTRTGRTPSAGLIDFGVETRCIELRLTGEGIMAVDAGAYG